MEKVLFVMLIHQNTHTHIKSFTSLSSTCKQRKVSLQFVIVLSGDPDLHFDKLAFVCAGFLGLMGGN